MTSNSIYNILLFGESGAGKSTTINALANYLQYSSFDQADSGKFVKVIPSKIILIHPKTYAELVCQDADSDPNEHHNDDGHSVTQSTKNYDFQFRGKTIRIIDTPGMGDTGGLEVDKRNFENILEHFKTLKTLHGICFLIKTNTTRKTAAFRYCLNQLMTHIPRHACANIVFCFTFSRNSLYGPGDGYATLKEHLRSGDLGCEKIELKGKENCFYIDNEAFRYLLAKKHGYPFTEDKKPQFLESWNKSVQQTLSMITRIVDNFEPFKIVTIFQLSDYRNFVQELNDPMNWLKDQIESEIDEQKKRAKNLKTGSNSYQKNFINNNVKLYTEELELLQEFIVKLIQFLVINLNTNCHNLIRPYLSLFTDAGDQATQKFQTGIQQESPNFPKRSKLSNEQSDVQTSPTSLAKIARIIESIKQKNSNQFDFENLKQSGQKLANLKFSGNQISKILGIEPTHKVPDFSRDQVKIPGTSKQIVIQRTTSKVIRKSSIQDSKLPNQNNRVHERVIKPNVQTPMAKIKDKINAYEANSSGSNPTRNSAQIPAPKSKIQNPSDYFKNSQLKNTNSKSSQKNNKSHSTPSTSTQINKPIITKQPTSNVNAIPYSPNYNSRTTNAQNTNPKVSKKNQSNQRATVPENQNNKQNNSGHNSRNPNSSNFTSYTNDTRQSSNHDYERSSNCCCL